MTGSRPVGIVLLGLAHSHAEPWARGIAEDPRAALVAVWDNDGERGRAFGQRHGAAFHADLDEALALPGADAVAVTAEHALRPEIVEAAARSGKHVLCEKPMATTLEGCDRIARAVADAGVTFMQAFQMRLDPVNNHVRELVRGGEIGRIGMLYKRHSHAYGLSGWPHGAGAWFHDPELAGGGAGMDQLIHSCDWLRWVVGEPVSVSAATRAFRTDGGVEDNIVATFRLVDGTIAILHSSWTEVAGTVTTQIFGDRGTIIQMYSDLASSAPERPIAEPLLVYRAGEPRWERPAVVEGFPRAHETVVQAFISCLADGSPPPASVKDGRRAVEMVLAAYRSAREGREVGTR